MSETTLLQYSTVYTSLERLGTFARQAAAKSRTTRLVRETTTTIESATATSLTGVASRTFARWTRSSWLFQWIITEPDSDIIAIDLHETWTVAPFLTVFDWIGKGLGKPWSGAVSRTVLQRGVRLFGTASKGSVVIKALAAALEPPEPTERERRESEHRDE